MECKECLRLSLCLLLCLSAHAQFTIRPVNTVSLVGSSPEFRCAANGQSPGLQWQFIEVADRGTENWKSISYQNSGISPEFVNRYEVIQNSVSTGFVDETLRLLDATSQDGVIYQCNLINTARVYWQHIVLESDPVCTSSPSTGQFVENESVEFTCRVQYYRELWPPAIVWSWVHDGSTTGFMNPANSTDNTEVVFNVTLQMLPEYNERQIQAVTSFGAPPLASYPYDDMSPEAPSYSYTYTTLKFDVLYFARNFAIDSADIRAEYNPGDRVSCSAEGSPVPSVQWVDTSTNNVVAAGAASGTFTWTATFTVTESMEGSHTYMCIARNTINGVTTMHNDSISFIVTIPTTTPPTTPAEPAPSLPCVALTDDECCDRSDECGLCRLNTGAMQCEALYTLELQGCSNNCASGWAAWEIALLVIGLILLIVLIILLVYCCCFRKKAPTKAGGQAGGQSGGQAVSYANGGVHVNGAAGKSPKDSKPKPRMDGVDTIRKPDIAYVAEHPQGPPPYSPYMQPQNRNAEGLMYANLALDDTPRSRKPIQVYEPTEYGDIQRV